MKAKDMREKSAEDLRDLEKSLTHEHFLARLKNFTNRLDDTSSIRRLRRDIARVKTLLGETLRVGGKPPAALPKRSAPKPAASKPAAPKAPASKPAAPKAAASASQLGKKAPESKSKVDAPSKPAPKKRSTAKKSESK